MTEKQKTQKLGWGTNLRSLACLILEAIYCDDRIPQGDCFGRGCRTSSPKLWKKLPVYAENLQKPTKTANDFFWWSAKPSEKHIMWVLKPGDPYSNQAILEAPAFVPCFGSKARPSTAWLSMAQHGRASWDGCVRKWGMDAQKNDMFMENDGSPWDFEVSKFQINHDKPICFWHFPRTAS